jgi:hypothetical protein
VGTLHRPRWFDPDLLWRPSLHLNNGDVSPGVVMGRAIDQGGGL